MLKSCVYTSYTCAIGTRGNVSKGSGEALVGVYPRQPACDIPQIRTPALILRKWGRPADATV